MEGEKGQRHDFEPLAGQGSSQGSAYKRSQETMREDVVILTVGGGAGQERERVKVRRDAGPGDQPAVAPLNQRVPNQP